MSMFTCEFCNKSFTNNGGFASHNRSKAHLEVVADLALEAEMDAQPDAIKAFKAEHEFAGHTDAEIEADDEMAASYATNPPCNDGIDHTDEMINPAALDDEADPTDAEIKADRVPTINGEPIVDPAPDKKAKPTAEKPIAILEVNDHAVCAMFEEQSLGLRFNRVKSRGRVDLYTVGQCEMWGNVVAKVAANPACKKYLKTWQRLGAVLASI